MGYYSDVRIGTTKKGFEIIKQTIEHHYADMLKEEINGLEVESEDKNNITVKSKRGIFECYTKKFCLKLDKLAERTVNGKDYVMFGWDYIKWIGYNFVDQRALRRAMVKSGEPFHIVAVGEDGASDEDYINDADEDYDMPGLYFQTTVDDGEWT